jgi:hypothetical protein
MPLYRARKWDDKLVFSTRFDLRTSVLYNWLTIKRQLRIEKAMNAPVIQVSVPKEIDPQGKGIVFNMLTNCHLVNRHEAKCQGM